MPDLRGIGALLVPHWGGIRWLLRDEFNDTRAAGAVNGTPATPGPGTRTVVDTANKLSVGSGVMSIAPKPFDWNDPNLSYATHVRVAGRLLLSTATFTLFDNVTIGWAATSAFRRVDATTWGIVDGGLFLPVATADTGVAYRLVIALRAAGAHYWLQLAGENPKLVWVGSESVTTPLAPLYRAHFATYTSDYVRIPDVLYIAQPLASDSFNRANGAPGSTDGAGTGQAAETGGAGLAWATVSGTWAISTNALVATAAGILTLPALSTADILDTWKIRTPAAGVTPGGIIVRYTDTDNYWYVQLIPGTAGTDFQLIERNAGVETARATADIDWVAATAYYVRVICEGSTWRKVFWGTTTPGALALSYTAANTFNQTAKVTGVRDEGNSNFTFDNCVVWSRGTDGSYSILNKWSS